MSIGIALADNPNCGKTTLFNTLTGPDQFVGNWPRVTVEEKEGRLKRNRDVTIVDLLGIYFLSPYTLEEVVARSCLIDEWPGAILNIVDEASLERNLYLSTQLIELGIRMVIAVNMMDTLEKKGDTINVKALERNLGCSVVEIPALKGAGAFRAAAKVVEIAKSGKPEPEEVFSGAGTPFMPIRRFSEDVEAVLEGIKRYLDGEVPESQRRFYTVKLFERDEKVAVQMHRVPSVETIIKRAEDAMDDGAQSVMTNERYTYIASMIG